MKKLFNGFENEDFHRLAGHGAGKFLYFAGGPKGPSVPEDKEDIDKQIEKALRSPLGFGVKELRFLEENAEHMNAFQKRRFRNIAGYQLSLARGKDMEDLPPRLLNHLADSPLRKLLPKRMQNQIIAEVDKQVRALGSIVNKNNWSTFELSKVCALYRRLQKNAVLKDGKRKDVFEKAREKIVDKAFTLMTKSVTSGDKAYDIIESKKNEVMTLEEKLLVLEIRRMFPNERKWAEKSRFYDWDNIAVQAVATLLKSPKKLYNPNMAFTWELLREFLGSPSEVESAETLRRKILSIVKEEEINKAFKSTEAIKFLQFAQKSPVFLPTHLQALHEILQEDFELVQIKDLDEWLNFSAENEELDKLEKKLRDLENKKLSVERYGLQSYLEGNETEKKKIKDAWEASKIVDFNKVEVIEQNYKKLLEEKNEIIERHWNKDFDEWVKDLEKAWESIKEKKLEELELEKIKSDLEIQKIEDEKRREELLKNNEKRFENKEKEIKEGIPAKIKRFSTDKASIGSDLKSREKFIEEFRELSIKLSSDLKENENYKKQQEGFKKYGQEINRWENQAKTLYGQVPIVSSYEEERNKLNEKYKKLKEKVRDETKNLDTYKTWQHFLKDPKKVARESKDLFLSNINSRIANRNLYAADFEVLWGDEVNNPRNPYYADFAEFRDNILNTPNKEKVNEFRQKFAGILESIFEDTVLPDIEHLSDGEDKFSPWYNELDKALSYENIIARLAEEGFDLRQEFPHPQQLSQLVDGAIHSYRDRIFDIASRDVRDELTEEELNDFYAGWDRIHNGLAAGVDPTKLHEDHVAYEQNKLITSQEIEDAHQVNEAYVERLRRKAEEETNPAKKQHYLDEADKLEESFEYRKQAYQRGGRYWGKDKNGKPKLIWAPGREFLNEIALQTQSVNNEIAEITNGLRDDIAQIAEKFRGISKMKDDPIAASLRQAEAKNELDKLFEKWPEQKEKLRNKFLDLGTVINEVLPEGVNPAEFTDLLMEVPMKMLDSFQKTFDNLQKHAKKIDYKFTGKETFWEIFADNFIKLETALNFRDGKFAKESESLNKYLEDSNRALELLTELQFFDDDTPDKEEFTKNYNEVVKGFKKDFAEYQEAINDVESRIRRDLNKMDDQDFFNKYGLDKEYLEDILSQHRARLNEFKEKSDKFFKSGFLKDWINRYDASPQDRAEAIAEMADFNSLRDYSKSANDSAQKIKKWVTEYDDNAKNSGPQRNYQRFSLYDLYAIVKQAIEVHERRWQRDSERAVANIGMSFFGEKSAWGKDFKQKAEEAEENRVKEFETQYGEVPGWDLQDALYRTNDQDEAKALIRLMLDKGVLQWDDPGLWRTLMRLSGNAVTFRIPEDLNLSRLEILDKVRNACEFIWSKETFRDWDTNLKGKLDSAIDSFKADFARYEDSPVARSRILSTMLKKWARGDSTDVDPAKYECFIHESFEKGKMNGQPDQRWYFLVMGVATINPKTNRSLISRDAFMRINDKFLARFPHVDFLTDKESYKLNGRIVPEDTPGAEKRGWTYEDYKAWGDFLGNGGGSFDILNDSNIKEQTKKFFYHIVHASPPARDRVSRMDRFSDKEGDHDDAESFFADWKQVHLINNMSQSSGGENKLSNDLWRRYLSGFPTYMQMMRDYIKEGDEKWGELPGWQKERKRALIEVGDRLNAALTVTQTLQGNINLGQERGSIVFNAEDWRKEDTGYSASAQRSKEQINSFMKQVFQVAGGDDGFGEVLDFMGVLEYGIQYKERKKKLEESGVWEKAKKLLDSPETREKYFENTEVIEKVLMSWSPPK